MLYPTGLTITAKYLSWNDCAYGCFCAYILAEKPYKGKKSEVRISDTSYKEAVFMLFLTTAITVIFYFVLKYFNTANLWLSTVSVFTSFLAVYLTFRRSPYFALAYALNDAVLIALWILASLTNASYLSVTVCFAVFLVNDLYGYISWVKIKNRQQKEAQ